MDNDAQQTTSDNLDGSEPFGTIPVDPERNGTVPHVSSEHQTPSATPPAEIRGAENGSESFRTIPNDSATFGTIQKDAEEFRKIPQASESFGRTAAESAGAAARKANHILTVSETARRFASRGVARTERSITNWCRPNKHGEARLDCFLDPNERKYFITPESVDLAIHEERARYEKNQTLASEGFGTIPNGDKRDGGREQGEAEETSEKLKAMRAKLQRLEVEAKFKDQWIEKYEEERGRVLKQIESISRYAGRLEGRVLEIDGPHSNLLKLESGSTDLSGSQSRSGDVDEEQDTEMTT